jgi:hypothetical protein
MQGMAEVLDSGDDFVAIRGAEKIALVAQVLASVPQEQSAVLNVTRREHKLKRTITFSLRPSEPNRRTSCE